MMQSHTTAWSLVALGVTLGSGVAAFLAWHDPWLAVIAGMAAGSLVRGFQTLTGSRLTWAAVLAWLSPTVVAAAVGLLSYTTWGALWLAVVLALVAGAAAGALAGVLAWLVRPTPVDLDAVLGGPADVFWGLRDTAAWQRLSRWVEHRSGTPPTSAAAAPR